ncbi:MAG TPA: class I tRNA ligase family protein [Candidatus Binatia bacterium]|nr:class I tRNA ligase family protein [Candidatus Binatia bacterium]
MLKICNSLTRKIEVFKPQEDMRVKMYTCGPSTYQPAHVGNYRTFLFEDILQRYLEYLGYKVERLMTLTDVEDKAIEQAKKENLTVEELTQRNEAIFFRDFESLKIKKPDYPIRASTAVGQAVHLISELLEKGTAYFYTYKGLENVYFNPLKFKGFGKLAHLDMSKWPEKKRRFHKDTYPGTPWNRGDFVLWHGCEEDDVCYQTPIGIGRPAWNIQDAAVVTKHLGFAIDVGCGGIDNLVRHHDYTLAVAEAVSCEPFSRYWLHGGHLYVDGKKMSKSKGNVYYPTDVLAKGFSGGQLRFFLIYGPYRKKLNFTFEKLARTSQKLDSFRKIVSKLGTAKQNGQTNESTPPSIASDFEKHMNNDLDVKGAFDSLYKTVIELHQKRLSLSEKTMKNILNELHRIDDVLQCIF